MVITASADYYKSKYFKKGYFEYRTNGTIELLITLWKGYQC